jgi:hypothetical protein
MARKHEGSADIEMARAAIARVLWGARRVVGHEAARQVAHLILPEGWAAGWRDWGVYGKVALLVKVNYKLEALHEAAEDLMVLAAKIERGRS